MGVPIPLIRTMSNYCLTIALFSLLFAATLAAPTEFIHDEDTVSDSVFTETDADFEDETDLFDDDADMSLMTTSEDEDDVDADHSKTKSKDKWLRGKSTKAEKRGEEIYPGGGVDFNKNVKIPMVTKTKTVRKCHDNKWNMGCGSCFGKCPAGSSQTWWGHCGFMNMGCKRGCKKTECHNVKVSHKVKRYRL